MIKRPFVLLFVAVGIIVAGLTLLCFLSPREPVYQGKRLSVWLEGFDSSYHEASQAIRAMGTNAVPWLIRELRHKDSAFKSRLMQLAGKQSLIKFDDRQTYRRRMRAIAACEALGPAAKRAIPSLTELFNNPKLGVDDRAAFALARMGPEAIPPLTQALTKGRLFAQIFAAAALRVGRFDSEEVVAALVKALNDKHPSVRREAANTLAEMPNRPAVAVPALIELLQDTNADVRMAAARAL